MRGQEDKRLRAVNFDLNIGELQKHFSKSNPKGAYKEIKRFMESNGYAVEDLATHYRNKRKKAGKTDDKC